MGHQALMARASTYRGLPGFGLSLGFTLAYLSLIVLVPLSAVFLKTATLSWPGFWQAVASPRVVASYKLTFGMSLLAALINTVFGFLLAWSLVRYRFPGKTIVDALVDLPFALPTAVAGISLTALLEPPQNFRPGSWWLVPSAFCREQDEIRPISPRESANQSADRHRRFR